MPETGIRHQMQRPRTCSVPGSLGIWPGQFTTDWSLLLEGEAEAVVAGGGRPGGAAIGAQAQSRESMRRELF